MTGSDQAWTQPIGPRALTLPNAALALVLASSVPRVSAAQDRAAAIRVAWVRGLGAESCFDGSTLERDILRRIGRDRFSDNPSRSIEVVVTHEGLTWFAHIFVRDNDGVLVGSRDLSSDSVLCQPIESATSLAVAMAIDPDATLRSLQPSSSPAPSPSPPASASPSPQPSEVVSAAPSSSPSPSPSPAPTVAAAPVTPPRDAPSYRLAAVVTTRAVVAWGLLPGLSPGLELSASGNVWWRLRWTVAMAWYPETRTSDQNFAFGLSAASMGLCADVVQSQRFVLDGCASVLAGAIHAVVFYPIPTQPGDNPWVGWSFGVRAQLRVAGPVVLDAGFEAVQPLTQYQFHIEGQSASVFSQSPLGVRGFVGAGLNFL